MTLQLTITELSGLTGKTRPTIYKYLRAYEARNLDAVPFTFIRLFEFMHQPNVIKKDVISFCRENFISSDSDIRVNEIVSLIQNNKDKIDLDRLKRTVEEEIKHG